MASQSKKLADQILIQWQPTTDDGSVQFSFNEYLELDGEITDYANPKNRKVMKEAINEVAQRMIASGVTDPITGKTLPELSGAAVITLIKEVVEQVRQEMLDEIRFREHPPSSNHTLVTTSSASIPADGKTELTVSVDLKDVDGENITWGGHDMVATSMIASPVGEDMKLTDHEDGTYSIDFVSSETGIDTIRIESNGFELGSVEVEFTEV